MVRTVRCCRCTAAGTTASRRPSSSTRTRPACKLEFQTGNDGELRERLAAEGEDTEADVYITVDAGNLVAATDQGLFQPIESAALDEAIPAELRDPDGNWYGLTMRARTIMYNPELIDEADVPSTYEELADPEWAGRLCLRDSLNGYQQSLVASLIAEHGEEETTRIVQGWADNAEILGNDVLVIESIADGICEVGVANHYYLGRELEENPDLHVKLKWANQNDRGVHVNISGGGVTTWADEPELAQQFLEWLATDGQSMLVDANHEYPANPAVAGRAVDHRRVRHRFRPRPAERRGARRAEPGRRAHHGRSGVRLTRDAYAPAVPTAARIAPAGPARPPRLVDSVDPHGDRHRRPGDHVGVERAAPADGDVEPAVADPVAR